MAPRMFYLLLLLSISILFVTGSVGYYNIDSFVLTVFVTILFFGFNFIAGRKTVLPRYFGVYAVFMLMLLVHYFIFGGQFFYFSLFITGGFYWVVIHNIRDLFSKHFFVILLSLGFSMIGLYIYSNFIGMEYLNQNLYHSISPEFKHNHLGDLWAVILVAIIYKISEKPKKWQYMLFVFGLIIIALSFSRSALLSLLAGAVVIFSGRIKKTGNRNFLYIIVFIFAIMFIFFGLSKNFLTSRPYYTEALFVTLEHPLGIGMGNYYLFTTSNATITFNLILEIILGIGIFSTIFVFWLIKIFRLFGSGQINTFYKAIFSAIFVNFMLDATYVIPTMVWLWFTSIALINFKEANIKGIKKHA